MADIVKAIKNAILSNNGSTAPSVFSTKTKEDYKNSTNSTLWEINGANWYKVFPHRFEIEAKGASSSFLDKYAKSLSDLPGVPDVASSKIEEAKTDSYYFALPIPPQSIRITPVYPAQATPTMGGVIEEVSQVTFWRIAMSGTTGTAIGQKLDNPLASLVDGGGFERKGLAKNFRAKIATTGLLNGLSTALGQTVSKFASVANNASNVAGAVSEGVTGSLSMVDAAAYATNSAVAAVNSLLLPPNPFAFSGVSSESNGFTEIHELQKFFHIYHALKGQDPARYRLKFVQYKTNQSWICVINNFSISQSSNNPNLYRYEIQLTGWDCQNVSSAKVEDYDRFKLGVGDLSPVNTVSLSSTKSGLSSIQNNINTKTPNTVLGKWIS